MSKPFWNSEKLLGFSALLISLGTLIVFMYQTSLIRKQQYMSVYPHLEFGNYGSGTLKYQYQLSNVGIGPAFLQQIKVKNGKTGEYEDVVDYVEDVITDSDSIMFVHSSLYRGRVIKPDEDIPLIQLLDEELLQKLGFAELDLPKNTVVGAGKLYELLNHDSLRIEVTYTSVYGETWTAKNGVSVPEKH